MVKHRRNGYKNHINIDVQHKLIRKFVVTPASTADVSCFEDLLDKKNKDKEVWADSAYRSEKTEQMLSNKGYKNRLHYKVKQGHYLPENYRRINYGRSVIRVRVEHAFGFMQNSMHRKFIRTIGMLRAKMKIGLMNFTYNICRYTQLIEPLRV